MKENLNTILQKYNYIPDSTDDYLTANIYDNKIINILDDYKNIISKIETRINEDWILQNCTEVNIIELSDFIENRNDSDLLLSDNINETRIICY